MVTIVLPIEIETPNRRFAPVGRCIYCGSTDSLSDEHIVPFGLVGDAVVLPQSSCPACATITGKVEQLCLRQMLGSLRVKIGLPTRRKKERPKQLTLQRGEFDPATRAVKATRISLLEKDDYPFVYPSIKFPPPGGSVGRDVNQDVQIQLQAITFDGDLPGKIGGHGKAILSDPIYPMEFARMIAKICHGYAVAEFGVDGFRPLLLPIILGRPSNLTAGYVFHFIGCIDEIPPATANALFLQHHKWSMSTGHKYLAVTFRLFPCFGTPVYQVIVGRLDDGLP